MSIKKPAVFLDRDGVLTTEKGYVHSREELEIFPYTAYCVKMIKQKGYHAIVITNQSGVARGLFTERDLQDMNTFLKEKIGVDGIFYCPHYEQGRIKEYARKCNCRKPQIGMIKQACRLFEIDLKNSFMVGDRAGDIVCGKRAGVQTVLLESGYGTKQLEMEVMPDYVYQDLLEFTKSL